MVLRVCVIGAGPCGLSTLAAFKKLANDGLAAEITCYEQQSVIGGMWNFNWRTGLDEHGEPLPNSMYRDLFSNGPKECLEFPDYTFQDHFKKNIPSCPPRAVVYDYIMGYMKFKGVTAEDVNLSHCVKNVTYSKENKMFCVRVLNLLSGVTTESEFDYLIVATSHFSVPHVPTFEGIETFNGRILHAHNFRNGREFKGQRVLLIGASYSAEDLTLQLVKFGAEHVTICHRSRPMEYKGWPANVDSVPLLSKVEDRTCHFIDGTSQEYDAIILCTGYKVTYPFLPSDLALSCGNDMSPPNLYRGVQWVPAEGLEPADGRLFYLGMSDLYYTYTFFLVQAEWSARVIKGLLVLPSFAEKRADVDKWVARGATLATCCDAIDFQSDQVNLLVKEMEFPYDLDTGYLLKQWSGYKKKDIMTYRDQVYESKFSKDISTLHPEPFMKCFDDSLEGYLRFF